MKAIFVLALIVLAANAQNTPTSSSTGQAQEPEFDGEAYFSGFAEKLGLTEDQLQHASSCFTTIQGMAEQLNDILQPNQVDEEDTEGSLGDEGTGSGSEGFEGSEGSEGSEAEVNPAQNIENMIGSLLNLYGNAKSSIQGECQPFLEDLQSALEPNFESPSMVGLSEDSGLDEVLAANWDFYFPQLIKQVGLLVQQLNGAQFSSAGATNAYILQILFGKAIPAPIVQATMPIGKSVIFNQKNFFNQFFNGFFKSLGNFKAADITNNIKSLSSCYDAFNKINSQIISFQKQIVKLSLLDSFYATKSFVSTFASNFKACKPAYQLVDGLRGKLVTKVNASKTGGWYQVFLNLSLNFAQIEGSLTSAAVYVDLGKYEQAGTIAANTIKSVFANVAPFPL
jgi:hypothetical protein